MTAQQQQTEDWNTSAQDALRVSVLSKDVTKGAEVSKWNVTDIHTDKAKVNKYAVLDGNPFDVDVAPEYEDDIPTLNSNEATDLDHYEPKLDYPVHDIIVAIYTPSDSHNESLLQKLDKHASNIGFVRYNETSAGDLDAKRVKADAFLVYMSDDDESPLLDQLLDNHADASTFFLVDTSVDSKTVAKIEEFFQENTLIS